MKVAVIGAGIFGITNCLKLSEHYDVTIFETKKDILGCASRTNQLRLHRGYHYPRSPETVRALIESVDYFTKEYSEAIIDDFDHFYCIAKKGSKVSPEKYVEFCKNFKLSYENIENFECVNKEKISLTLKVRESLIDYNKLYKICKERLRNSNAKINLGTTFKIEDLEKFDVILNCTYADINQILCNEDRKDYQFEICEKILINPHHTLKEKSIVVMDGPFMCIDPYGRTGNSLLGNVVHAIHSSNIGKFPVIPQKYTNVLNKGIIDCKSMSKYSTFIKSGKDYIKMLDKSTYLGSMFTIRAVLPYVDKTDERPTIISNINEKVINVFSGKIDTCSITSKLILNQIKGIK